MIQYNKYGDYVPLEQGVPFDLRVAQQFLFYIGFSLFTGSFFGSKEQAKGISFTRAIGIVFLLNEIEQLFYYQ